LVLLGTHGNFERALKCDRSSES